MLRDVNRELLRRAERIATLEARLAKVVEALKRLRAEARGLIALERDALIALVSLTNVRCVEWAIEQADAALAAAQPEEDTFDARLRRSWLPAAQEKA